MLLMVFLAQTTSPSTSLSTPPSSGSPSTSARFARSSKADSTPFLPFRRSKPTCDSSSRTATSSTLPARPSTSGDRSSRRSSTASGTRDLRARMTMTVRSFSLRPAFRRWGLTAPRSVGRRDQHPRTPSRRPPASHLGAQVCPRRRQGRRSPAGTRRSSSQARQEAVAQRSLAQQERDGQHRQGPLEGQWRRRRDEEEEE